MGASNFKKQRESERREGLNARELAEREAAAKRRKTRNKYILIGILIVILVAAVLFINSPFFYDGLPALSVGDVNYTVADVNYYYQASYMSFYNSYSSYISFFLDPSQPLDQQKCTVSSEDQTWAEYFQQAAIDNLRQVTAFYDAAVKAGYTLTEEDQNTIDSTINDYVTQAQLYNYTLDSFLISNFGEGNNEKNVREQMAKELIVNRYLADQYESYTYTDEELDAYYEENADDYDTVQYSYCFLSGAADTEAGIDEETAMAQAGEKAQTILDTWDGGDLEAFEAAVLDVTETEASATSSTKSSFATQFEESLNGEEPQPGTAFVRETTGGWYVVYVSDVYDCRYPTVDVRHILIKAVDEDGDGEYSDAEKQAAYDRIVEIRDEWLSGSADEAAFMTAAALYSEDTGSNSNGGLYEQISKGRMVKEFNDFCFDDHEAGDYDIVYGESSSYAGYHLVYFVGENEIYSRLLADNAMRSADYQAFCEELTAPYEASKRMMWRFVMP